uniref:Uncharacterized protein n=1 Tax=Acrobeloides nanus TaxID=290746 RepID=A0A914D8C3_9BILA
MKHYSFSVSILLWFLLRLSNEAKVERDLYELLLNDYNATIRPVQNAGDNVTVYMGLSLQQIIDVNEKDQEVELNAWLKFNWTDPQLRWNPEEFDGITDLRFKKDQLWTPDILLYNSVAEDFNTIFPTNLVVYYNGIVNWIPPGVFQLSCRIDVTWFPFDEQVCFMKFGSWTYHSLKVDLRFATENDFDLSTYMENGEWTIKDVYVERRNVTYKCCPEPYLDLTFYIRMQRKTLFYGFNLILPCIGIAILTIIGFTMPPEGGEKMSIQVNVLLSIYIFQNYVSEMTPTTSEAFPFLGLYFLLTILTVSGSVVSTVLILNFYNRSEKSHFMSPIMYKVFIQWLPWFLMMKKSRRRYIPRDFPRLSSQDSNEAEDVGEGDRYVEIMHSPHRDKIPAKKLVQLLLLEQILDDLKEVNAITKKQFEEDLESTNWRYVAIVFDRLSLFVSCAFVIISTTLLFSSILFA